MDAELQTLVLSIAATLIADLILWLVLEKKTAYDIKKRVAIVVIVACILLPVFQIGQDQNLVTVPNLKDNSKDSAEALLMQNNLVPLPRYENSYDTPKDQVIPFSQDPVAGTRVWKGTQVSYAVSMSSFIPQGSTPAVQGTTPSVTIPPVPTTSVSPEKIISIKSPVTAQNVRLQRDAAGIYTFSVEGTLSGSAPADSQVLLWIEPVNPRSDVSGWYLQRNPNGVINNNDGTWSGRGQLGNQQWPPHNGDTFNILVTVVDRQKAQELMGMAGVVVLVNPPGTSSDRANNLVVSV